MNTNKTLKVIVGTVKKFNRNHLTEVIVQEGLPRLAGRPRQSPEDSGDVRSEISMPSIFNSP